MQYRIIESESNAKYKRWKKLFESARFIKKEGATLAEGAHLIITMKEKGVKPEAFLLREGGVSDEVAEIIEDFANNGVPCYVLANTLYDKISPVEHGAGIMAEIKITANELPIKERCDVLYLDGVQDPGNVGTLIRTAVAAGVSTIAASRESASLWSAKALRAAMGAHFSARLYENVEPEELDAAFEAVRLAADARGGSDLYETADWEKTATVWMMGAEGPGLSDKALNVADRRLYIPIESGCESLNVGAAAAVCLFEQKRRRIVLKSLK